MSEPEVPVSFETNIKPMFREKDRESMQRVGGFDLWSLDDVRTRAGAILDVLRAGRMPCDGRWSDDQVERFGQWKDSGMAP